MNPDAAMVVEHLVQVERTVQTRDPMDLLVRCNDLAAVDWRDEYALATAWAAIMGRSPSSVECACKNAIAWVLDGRPPEGDRWSGGERRPDDEVRRDFRSRKSMRKPWGVVPMETYPETEERLDRERKERVERLRQERTARYAEDDRAADKERRFTQGAVDKALSSIAQAGKGSRNHTLNRCAYSLGGLVGSGLLDEADVVEVLVAAAVAAGVRDREARRVVADGLAAGKQRPRGMER